MVKQVSNDDIMTMLAQFADGIDKRFDGIDKRFDGIDKRLDGIDIRLFKLEEDNKVIKRDIANLQASHDRLLNTVDRFIARIDTYETEQIARDGQFQQLLAWARKVSEKTGIPLENL